MRPLPAAQRRRAAPPPPPPPRTPSPPASRSARPHSRRPDGAVGESRPHRPHRDRRRWKLWEPAHRRGEDLLPPLRQTGPLHLPLPPPPDDDGGGGGGITTVHSSRFTVHGSR